MPNFVGGIGPLQPDLMCIAEAPGKLENETGIPLVGPTGEIFNDCKFTSLLKCCIQLSVNSSQ